MSQFINLVGIFANIALSIGIIQINKYAYINCRFPNMTLTCIHFIVTFVGLLICKKLGAFQHKHVPLLKMIPMAFTFCGFVVLANFSLEFNSIGTYQCLKVLTTPGVVLAAKLYHNRQYSSKVKLTIIPVVVGVFLNGMYDLKFSLRGVIFGLAGAAVTSLYQVFVGEKQKEFNLNSLQLLYYQAPLSAIILMILCPFFEPLYHGDQLIFARLAFSEWLVVLSSAVMAFFVNLSIYWLIARTSPLTYNMVGHMKFILGIVFGLVLFNEKINIQQFASFVLILFGLTTFSLVRMKENQNETKKE